jgi:hypothetical protein
MEEKPVPKEPETVACEVCLAEIPSDAAMHQEADEYTQHFCGIECYSQWKQKRENDPHRENKTQE